MTSAQYDVGYGIGHAAAMAKISDLNERDPFWRSAGTLNGDDLDDMAHPDAFSDALDALPECEAAEISDAVHAGISAAMVATS